MFNILRHVDVLLLCFFIDIIYFVYSWDEWVPESRVLKFNDANLQKQRDLHKAQKNEP